MTKDWFARLIEVIEADGRSKSAISLECRFGRNYVQQMILNSKEPGADHLARLLEVLGPGASLYVYTGQRISEEDRQFLELLGSMRPELKRAALDLFQKMLDGAAPEAPRPSDPDSS